MTLDFTIIAQKMIFAEQFKQLINGNRKSDQMLAEIKKAYEDSEILRVMFSKWINDRPTRPIEINYKANDFAADLDEGRIYIDPDYIKGLTYITEQGKSLPYLLIQAIIHEFGHALEGKVDPRKDIGFSDLQINYKGTNVPFVNTIWEELGFEPMSTYFATAQSYLQPTGYKYTKGSKIDNAVNVESVNNLSDPTKIVVLNWNTSNLTNSLSKDLLIGGYSDNVLTSNNGSDFLFGGDGSDILDGGNGVDTAVYFGKLKDYKISPIIAESFNPLTLSVTRRWYGSYTISGGRLGLNADNIFQFKDIVTDIEYAQFDDQKVALQTYLPKDIAIDAPLSTLLSQNPTNDLNGDGNSDILWRNIDGSVAIWSLEGNAATPQFVDSVSLDWTIAGTGDFNGDLTEDILWRNDNGDVALWTMNDSIVTTSSVLGTVGIDWKIVGTGDFNGDSESDILWRNDDGRVALWQMNDSIVTTSRVLDTVSLDWTIVETGDFNSDGESDILWRNDNGDIALWQINDSAYTTGAVIGTVTSDWKIAGSSDFNGDGSSDILWRNDDGRVALWQINDLAYTTRSVIATESTDWTIAETGDFNGDGKSDILWRNDNGAVATWQMDGSYVVSRSLTSIPSADLAWNIAAPILYT
jgi:FG-GAP-like repeat/RTX calcium-binding nonapeptide repeat (4 copies)